MAASPLPVALTAPLRAAQTHLLVGALGQLVGLRHFHVHGAVEQRVPIDRVVALAKDCPSPAPIVCTPRFFSASAVCRPASWGGPFQFRSARLVAIAWQARARPRDEMGRGCNFVLTSVSSMRPTECARRAAFDWRPRRGLNCLIKLAARKGREGGRAARPVRPSSRSAGRANLCPRPARPRPVEGGRPNLTCGPSSAAPSERVELERGADRICAPLCSSGPNQASLSPALPIELALPVRLAAEQATRGLVKRAAGRARRPMFLSLALDERRRDKWPPAN